MASARRRRSVVRGSRLVLAEALEGRVLLTGTLAIDPRPQPPVVSAAAEAAAMEAGPQFALSVPALSSYPSATAKIYLDFDGQPATNWEGQSVPATPAYSVDATTTSFSLTELANINEIWARVAEKYSPFNIDVTTVRPTDFNNLHAVQVVIGGDGTWSSGGGVAYVDAFNNSLSNTCWVFSAEAPTDLQFVAEAAAHEAGHTFGLQHHSEYSGTTNVQEYSDNDPATTGEIFTAQPTAPIMGYSYSAGRGLWWKGPNDISSTTIQDDMAVISKVANGFGYRTDDHGDTPGTADAMTVSGTSTVTASGVISKTADKDFFSFQTMAGSVSFTVSVATTGATLNAKVELWSASGSLVTKDTAALGETVTFTVPSTGTYYVAVESHGTYGDVGTYTVAGTINPVPLTPVAGGPYAVVEGGTVQLSGSGSLGQIAKYEWDLDYDGSTFDVDKMGVAPTVSAGTFDGPAVRTIALRVTDVASNTAIVTTTLTVSNANPTATLVNSGAVEGSTTATVTFNNSTDPSTVDVLAGFIYSYDFDNDGTFDLVSGSPVGTIPAELVADGPVTLTVRGRIADKDGGFHDYTTAVVVTNRLPTATVGVTTPVAQGSDATITFTNPADAAADVSAGFTYSYSFNDDLTFEVVDSTSASVVVPASALGDAPGARVLHARIKDHNGGYTDYAVPLTVVNVSPTATPVVVAGDEGSDFTVTLTNPFDPSTADTTAGFKYSFDVGNDGTFEVVNVTSNTYTYVMPDQGTYTMLARVKDKNGGYTDYVETVVAGNMAPASSISATTTVKEGSAGAITFGAVTDASAVDAAAGYTYSYDLDGNLGDGYEISGSTSATAVVPAAYLADGPFTRTVHARVTDKDGGHSDYTAAIVVTNVAPTIQTSAGANAHVVLGTGYALSVAGQDPGQDTVSTWTVNWGDGSSSQKTTPTAAFAHDYAAKGEYAVVITAVDEDGSYTLNRAVSVTSDPPTAAFSAGALAGDGSEYEFTVAYDDDLGVRPETVGAANVSVVGPHGAAQSVRLVSTVATDGGKGVTATYAATGPVGAWAWQDDGTYLVSVNVGAVGDLQGDAVAAGQVGTFAVGLAAPVAADLVPTLTGTIVAKAGAKNKVSVKVANRGTKTLAATNVTTGLYLSKDVVWDASDKLLTSSVQKLGLAINASKTVSMSFVLPAGSAAGTYYVLARVDTKNKVAERDERNNVAASKKFNLVKKIVAPKVGKGRVVVVKGKKKGITEEVFNTRAAVTEIV